ncbi:MAG: hypothetical protein AB1567_07280 [bacterium]
MRKILGVVILLMMMLSYALGEELAITQVSIDSNLFNPSKGESVRIFYHLSKDAMVSVKIFDADYYLIRELLTNEKRFRGINSISWDGRDIEDKIVPDEAYYFIIEAQDELGAKAVYDPTTFSGGEVVFVPVLLRNFDPKTKDVHYQLPKPTRVRIRAGVHDGPLLKTICDWEPRVAGSHTEKWDGMDESGIIRVKEQRGFNLTISAFTLPENSIITIGNKELKYIQYKKPITRKKKIAMSKSLPRADVRIHSHYRFSRTMDRSSEFRIELPPETERDKNGIPVIRGEVELRIILDEVSKRVLSESRFELVLYVDNVLWGEEEQGYEPYTWILDTKKLRNGEHTITINVATLTDQVGAASLKVKVNN